MNDIDTLSERLRYLRKDVLKLNQTEFAGRIFLSQNFYAQVETNKRNLTDRSIADIVREYNVNEDWLRDGTGAIFKETDDITLDEYAKQKKATNTEVELFKAYLNLSDELRNELINFIVNFGNDKTTNPNIKVLDYCVEEDNHSNTHEVTVVARSSNNEGIKTFILSDAEFLEFEAKLTNAPKVTKDEDL